MGELPWWKGKKETVRMTALADPLSRGVKGIPVFKLHSGSNSCETVSHCFTRFDFALYFCLVSIVR